MFNIEYGHMMDPDEHETEHDYMCFSATYNIISGHASYFLGCHTGNVKMQREGLDMAHRGVNEFENYLKKQGSYERLVERVMKENSVLVDGIGGGSITPYLYLSIHEGNFDYWPIHPCIKQYLHAESATIAAFATRLEPISSASLYSAELVHHCTLALNIPLSRGGTPLLLVQALMMLISHAINNGDADKILDTETGWYRQAHEIATQYRMIDDKIWVDILWVHVFAVAAMSDRLSFGRLHVMYNDTNVQARKQKPIFGKSTSTHKSLLKMLFKLMEPLGGPDAIVPREAFGAAYLKGDQRPKYQPKKDVSEDELFQDLGLTETKSCARCHARGKNLLLCSRCKKTRYCDQNCQRKDWPKHKLNCK
eukprot:TRINITY_DN10133_c3_g1_i1.p1 TRINITY_DN10133_c3_g1~~TRINITY_DN10133_c3_g1_i1.p1  ORF type:complete len:376 (-),score=26.11 TRINITY_DN10133_c3_g1_i1:228-1325(-)